MTPQNLGRYEILGELGKGAMGVVYLAQDPIIKRQLAIKTFRMAYSAKEKEVAQFRERFLREAQAIGQLSHPNIVTVHDVGQEGEDYFIAMEYVKGVNLKQRMQHDEPLALEFVLEVVAQIADGLDCAHQKGIIHRDVKPANIIITHDHLVKITDFGIARLEQSNLTVAGQLLGTPNYMAPEQIQGRAVDARSDIFSLGVLLYELLTRKKPFQGENLTQVSHRIVYDEFTPPEEYVEDLPEPVLKVLNRALEKTPEARYQQASEMARELRSVLALADGGPAGEATAGEESTGGAVAASAPGAAPAQPVQPAQPSLPAAEPAPPAAAVTPPAPPVKPPPSLAPAGPSPARLRTRPPAARAPGLAARPLWPGRELFEQRKAIVVAAAAVAAVGIASLALARLLGGGASPAAPAHALAPIDEFHQREAAVIARAEQLAAAGVPEQALATLAGGLAELPYSLELTRGYFRTAPAADRRQDVLGAYVRERMLIAEAYITAKQYESAYDVLELVLFADPSHPRARERTEDIERFLGRRRQAQIRAERQSRPEPSAPAAPPPAPSSPAPPPEGELTIAFRTIVAAGKLTVFAQDAVVFEREFDFPNRRTLKRKYLKGERGFDETLTLPAGTLEVRATVEVEVKADRMTLTSPLLTGNIPEALSRTLRITVGEDATLDVRFE